MPDISLLPDNIASKISVQPNGCWHWISALNDQGYGVLTRKRKQYRAHRFVYELLVGPIPQGLDLDHECHIPENGCKGGKSCLHRRCVNPDHVGPKTRKDNLARGVQTNRDLEGMRKFIRPVALACQYGHTYVPGSFYVYRKTGSRLCKICSLQRYWVKAA